MNPVVAPTGIGPHRPLRVHVVGNSTAVLVEPEHGTRDGGTFGEQLGPMLAAAAIPATVTHVGRWFGRVNEVVADYERDVRDVFPDVLVLSFGIIECQPDTLPTWLARHLQTWRRTSRPGARLYRERVAPVIWRRLRDYQRRAAQFDDVTHRLRPHRFVTDFRRLIDLARKDCGCLVLVLDIDPPGARMRHWLPGIDRRVARYNQLLAEVTSSYDDTVQLVAASSTVLPDGPLLPDGIHRSTEGHRLTAQLLCDTIQQWLSGGAR